MLYAHLTCFLMARSSPENLLILHEIIMNKAREGVKRNESEFVYHFAPRLISIYEKN